MEDKLSKIESSITFYSRWAWALVFAGVLPLLSCVFLMQYNTVITAKAAKLATVNEPNLVATLKANNVTYLANIGNIGSYLQGTTASFWTLASFLFIYVAFLGQEKQNLLRDKENEEQRNRWELEAFEGKFFQLLGLHNNTVNSLHVRGSLEYNGRDAVTRVYQKISLPYQALKGNTPALHNDISDLRSFYNDKRAEIALLSPYFRNVYSIVKFVSGSTIRNLNKDFYFGILMSQLSHEEMCFLFYDILCTNFGNPFKPIFEQNRLFAVLDRSKLMVASHEHLFEKTAYQEYPAQQ